VLDILVDHAINQNEEFGVGFTNMGL